jgi:hypothetical protein
MTLALLSTIYFEIYKKEKSVTYKRVNEFVIETSEE